MDYRERRINLKRLRRDAKEDNRKAVQYVGAFNGLLADAFPTVYGSLATRVARADATVEAQALDRLAADIKASGEPERLCPHCHGRMVEYRERYGSPGDPRIVAGRNTAGAARTALRLARATASRTRTRRTTAARTRGRGTEMAGPGTAWQRSTSWRGGTRG